MNNRLCYSLVILVSAVSAGCASTLKNWEMSHQFMVGAETLPANLGDTSSGDSKTTVAKAVGESERRCSDFMAGLVLAHNTASTALDLGTTIFTAAGTAFTPLGTVHALTAAGSITSGSKIAVESDIYAKANVGNFSQAIQATYYVHINQYLDALSKMKLEDINVAIEIAKIRTIHAECALASAQSTISATLSNATAPSDKAVASNKKIAVSVSGAIPASDTIILIAASSSAIPPLKETIQYNIKITDKSEDIVAGLIKAISNNPTLSSAGIKALPDPSAKSAFSVSAPSSLAVDWSVQVLANGKPDATVGVSITDVPTVSSGVVPGSGIGDTSAKKNQ